MKQLTTTLLFLLPYMALAQNVQTDSQSYTPQQLVEDILIHSDCVSNVVVTNVVGGNFNGTDQSYGYFDGSGTSFPFTSGIVLSTGRLQNVQGPNTSLSDDDAAGWNGDNDLEAILAEPNTFNATILEFEFTTIADQINFNYIFASEEYQFNNANTCQYSDLFGFLIRPASSTQYTNIALVPNTQTPVKVTTVHPEIPGGCAAQNEAYFGSWNDATAPINFNGQTAVLTATANVIPNETYHVKLVIADEQNYRYDSAVFLQEGSFTAGKNLGPNRLLSTENPLCGTETLTLDATMPGATGYQWYLNGNPLAGETSANHTVTQPGTYQVEIVFSGNCMATGTISIEYAPNPTVQDSEIIECDMDMDGITYYNLLDATSLIINNDNSLMVTDFFLTQSEAEQNTNPIPNPTSFLNSVPSQIVYARVISQYQCSNVAEVELSISNESLSIPNHITCGPDTEEGLTLIDFDVIHASFQDQIPSNATVNYYETETDAINEVNSLPTNYYVDDFSQYTIFVKVTNTVYDCFALGTVTIQAIQNPVLMEDETVFYCLNDFPQTINLSSGLIVGGPSQHNYAWTLNGTSLNPTTETIQVNETGTYTVEVSNAHGCVSSRTITVLPSEIATLESLDIQGNSLTAYVSGAGDYEFSIDQAPFQESNTFVNIPMGFHTLYVKDKNGCGIIEIEFGILGFPTYFTPNGDGYNDVWKPKGLELTSRMKIYIFDRYGKLLKEFDPHTSGWNGSLNDYPVPSDDYWFLATLEDGTEYRGHFALVR